MASLTIGWETRPAMFTIKSNAVAMSHNLPKDSEHKVYVHGLIQYKDEDSADAYFICEFEDGRCFYADPRYIRFIDGGGS